MTAMPAASTSPLSVADDRAVLVAGCDMRHGDAVCERLRADGWDVCALAYERSAGVHPDLVAGAAVLGSLPAMLCDWRPGFHPRRVVALPRPGSLARVEEVQLASLLANADDNLVTAEILARLALSNSAAGSPGRIVLLSTWAAFGLEAASSAAPAMAGLLSLARSWAIEAGSAATVNAVIAGPGVEGSSWDTARPPLGRHPTGEEVAQAVAFFLDERSRAISGQVLSVCGGLTPGLMPI